MHIYTHRHIYCYGVRERGSHDFYCEIRGHYEEEDLFYGEVNFHS